MQQAAQRVGFLNQQGKNWCWTYNYGRDGQVTEEDALANVRGALVGLDNHTYSIFSWELAPTTGQPHLQGYSQFETNMRGSAMKKLMPTASFRKADGDDEENYNYVRKMPPHGDGSQRYEEYGDRRSTDGPRKQKRDYAAAFELARQGRLDEIDKQMLVCHMGSLMKVQQYFGEPIEDLETTTGIWIVGTSGTGKTTFARDNLGFAKPQIFAKPLNKWLDGYDINRHKMLLLEDVGKEHAYLGHFLKIWADEKAFPAETKGGGIRLRPEKVVVTSQYCLSEVWSDRETLDALERRFEVIHIHIDGRKRKIDRYPPVDAAAKLADLEETVVTKFDKPAPTDLHVGWETPARLVQELMLPQAPRLVRTPSIRPPPSTPKTVKLDDEEDSDDDVIEILREEITNLRSEISDELCEAAKAARKASYDN